MKFIKIMKDKKYIQFKDKRYCLNLGKLKNICLTPSSNEYEITQVYGRSEDGDMNMESKVEREVKNNNSGQNEAILYDIVKMMIIKLFENNVTSGDIKKLEELDLGTIISINTLISWEILEEIE